MKFTMHRYPIAQKDSDKHVSAGVWLAAKATKVQ